MTDRLTDTEIQALIDDAAGLYTFAGRVAAVRRLAREVLELRARVAALEAERWPIPGTEGDERYTVHALLGRVVAAQSAKGERRVQAGSYEPVWSGVRVVTGLGSTYSQALCRAYGYHPDTGARLAPTGGSDA